MGREMLHTIVEEFAGKHSHSALFGKRRRPATARFASPAHRLTGRVMPDHHIEKPSITARVPIPFSQSEHFNVGAGRHARRRSNSFPGSRRLLLKIASDPRVAPGGVSMPSADGTKRGGGTGPVVVGPGAGTQPRSGTAAATDEGGRRSWSERGHPVGDDTLKFGLYMMEKAPQARTRKLAETHPQPKLSRAYAGPRQTSCADEIRRTLIEEFSGSERRN